MPRHEMESSGSNPWMFVSVLLGVLLIASFVTNIVIISKVTTLGSQTGNLQAGTQPTPSAAAPSAPTAPTAPVNIQLAAGTPFLGNANAKVTVVEYADYQCPFCERFYTQTMPSIKTAYIDTGKIKFYYQDFAFLGPGSTTAGEAVLCAQDQNKFWEYHDYLFAHQGQEGSGWATADHLKQFAQAVGLDTTKFNTCLDSGKYSQQVQDQTNAGRTYGVTGTPSVFVNGQLIVGAQPYTAFKQAIDAALAAS